MKNLNTDVNFYSAMDTSVESQGSIVNVYGMSKGIPTVAVVSVRENLWGIPSLNFILSINAVERITPPIHDEGDNEKNTIFFDHKYEICIRLTEPHSGAFVDLDSFSFSPGEEQLSLCRKIYFKNITCQYNKISVKKSRSGGNMCVLKILVRHASPNNKWIVQSIHPIQMVPTNA